MSEASSPQQAIGWLEIQVERLAELRNATTRDSAFREWRQNTLTMTQRIWPDIPNRSTRFRRIPFSPASTRADDQEVRVAFDKGCAEARRMLKLWVTELETHGFVTGDDGPRRSSGEGAEDSPQTPSAAAPRDVSRAPASVRAATLAGEAHGRAAQGHHQAGALEAA